MKTAWASQIRTLADTLSEGGKKTVSTQMLCAALGITGTPAKTRVRRSITCMVKRGEMERIRDGEYRYFPKKATAIGAYGESYKRMWRIIRTEKAGWTVNGIASTTRLHSSTISEYCKYLEQEGFIARCGKQGNARLFRATQKATEQRETPYPPCAPKDTYVKERNAACRIICAFTKPNPALDKERIITDCRAILARFEKENVDVEP